jgi:predicted nuclease of predicted toxin-antitoxin system
MKVLIDMNLSPIWEGYLRRVGIEARHWKYIGNPDDPDEVIFAWAKQHGYIVFTNDLDFGAILAATNARGPSVIQLRVQDLMAERLAPRLVVILEQYRQILDEGALISVDERRAKVRILPLQRS